MSIMHRGLEEPERNKMVAEPGKKKTDIFQLPPDSAPKIVIRGLVKNPWAPLIERERSIHGGSGMHR